MGGNAIKCASKIPNNLCEILSNSFIKTCKSKLKISESDFILLGSTGKKLGDYNDLDIGVDINQICINNNIDKSKVFEFIWNKLGNTFSNKFNMSQLGVISFGIQFDNKIGQIDLILLDNLRLGNFLFFAPSEGKSKYKGLFRTELLLAMASVIPIKNNIVEIFNDEYNGKNKGESKIFWKYTLNRSFGLKKQLKSVEGKTKKLKTPFLLKEEIVSNNVDEIINFLFGPKIKEQDLETFEQIWNIITKKEFKWNRILKEIIYKYIDIIENDKRLETPIEVKKYLKTFEI